jgi:membrane protease YdiL (CAAX protease family)
MVVFACIMAYIWGFRATYSGSWLIILGLIIVSHLSRRERAGGLGFCARGIAECWRAFAPAFGLIALLLLAAGILLGTIRPLRSDQLLMSWVAYLPWGLFQQYLLNGYFLNRLHAVIPGRGAALMAAALFSTAHTPNWFLMAVGLVAGYACALIYRRHRNLYFLGLAHGTVGFLLFLVAPDWITHHMRVGPGWFR